MPCLLSTRVLLCGFFLAAATWSMSSADVDAQVPTTTHAEGDGVIARLHRALQPVVDAASHYHNVSFSVGVATSAGTVTVQSGLNQRGHTRGEGHNGAARPTKMGPSARFPLGSVTKSWTAIAVMQQYELGKIDIDLPVSVYVRAHPLVHIGPSSLIISMAWCHPSGSSGHHACIQSTMSWCHLSLPITPAINFHTRVLVPVHP